MGKFSFLAVFAAFTSGLIAASDFQTGQDASIVVGQENFNGNTVHAGGEGLSMPTGIAVSPVTGKLFICDTERNRVLRYGPADSLETLAFPEAIFGAINFANTPAGNGQTNFLPEAICVDSADRLWVSDTQNNRVLRFDDASLLMNLPSADQVLGQPDYMHNPTGNSDDGMWRPKGLYADANGTLWVADSVNNRVLRFDNVTSKAAGGGAKADGVLGQPILVGFSRDAGLSPSGMNRPSAVTGDAEGHIWVVDQDNHRVLRFDDAAHKANGADANGVIGQADFYSAATGTTATTLSTTPTDVRVSPEGRLFIADTGNRRVLWYDNAAQHDLATAADGVIGQDDFISSGGANTASRFIGPWSISLDNSGNLWVTDRDFNRALRFDPIAIVTPVPTSLTPHPVVLVKGKRKLTTTAAQIVLKGSASDVGGTLSQIEVKVGAALFKPARGQPLWKFKAKLKPGKNTILVQARDAGGTTSAIVKITILRK